jgi:hypothetical protein
LRKASPFRTLTTYYKNLKFKIKDSKLFDKF